MLTIKDLIVRYPKAKENALNKVNVTMNKGEFICVLGKSGAGKSTFIRTINRLQVPSSGKIIWDDLDLTSLSETKMRKVRSDMVMIFQHFNLIPRMTVFQNTLTGSFGQRPPYKNMLGIFSEEERTRGIEALKEVGLENHMDKRVELLSGGQKQRVGIARALLQDPQILLGDEPVASLDPTTSRTIFEILKRIHEERQLLSIVNIHDVHLAKEFATRIIAFREGELMFDGKPDEVNDKIFAEIYQ
ncbi:phosphonate ABC transporter ATP-binding protein [Halalkalibacter wakoensis JCM 9140]|uniref:Phosphonate ABC transporter ATP-binding protein n=1 Tax=Halalkalibacter wakoensis JCM 9140 TaxID=1236970 RepID=W4PY90_9BACI|nr:phosphonate ABC transporter ATP-binding protein [Halalkalibacter wakoensis]GAE24418.1 phosphonate ABC transporter ATP-binding protein [Halalkalibacter wakoensis JCM 9140]